MIEIPSNDAFDIIAPINGSQLNEVVGEIVDKSINCGHEIAFFCHKGFMRSHYLAKQAQQMGANLNQYHFAPRELSEFMDLPYGLSILDLYSYRLEKPTDLVFSLSFEIPSEGIPGKYWYQKLQDSEIVENIYLIDMDEYLFVDTNES